MAATKSGVKASIYPHETHHHVKTIEKTLTEIQAISGDNISRIFENWCELTEVSLHELVRRQRCHIKGEKHEDSEETQAVFERLRNVYDRRTRDVFTIFSRAMGQLMNSAEAGYMDVIGSCYMAFGWPSRGAGQYFTPWNVAQMMAQMIQPGAGIDDRLKEAIHKSPLATAALLTSYVLPDELVESWMIARVIPYALPEYEPVTLNEPCCGSGIMFLAAATTIEAWKVQMGLIQMYGQDIDFMCVRMARINSMLYGLNGIWAPSLVMENEARLKAYDKLPADPPPAEIEVNTPESPELPGQLPEVNPRDFVQMDLFNTAKAEDGSALKEPAAVYAVV